MTTATTSFSLVTVAATALRPAVVITLDAFLVRPTPRSAAGASDASRGPLEREVRRLSADQGGPEPLTKVSRLWTRAISTAAARRWDRCASTCRDSTT